MADLKFFFYNIFAPILPTYSLKYNPNKIFIFSFYFFQDTMFATPSGSNLFIQR